MRRRVRIVYLAGLALVAAALVVTLSRAPLTLAHSNAVPDEGLLSIFHSGATVCQPEDVLPQGTTAIRFSILMAIGGGVTAKVLARSRVLTHGSRPPGWRGRIVTVPVSRVSRTVSNVTVCLRLGPTSEPAGLIGTPGSARVVTVDAHPSTGRIRIEYLRRGPGSWWSRAQAIARRMGLGRAWTGASVALAAVLLMGAMTLTASWLVMRRLY